MYLEVSVVAKADGYNEPTLANIGMKEAVPEIGLGTKFEDVTPAQIDALRARIDRAIKETQKRLHTELDLLEEQAAEREAKARKEKREKDEAEERDRQGL